MSCESSNRAEEIKSSIACTIEDFHEDLGRDGRQSTDRSLFIFFHDLFKALLWLVVVGLSFAHFYEGVFVKDSMAPGAFQTNFSGAGILAFVALLGFV